MPTLSVCVYCASSTLASGEHLSLAHAVGRSLAMRGIRLVYGGGRVGLMGAVADGALAHGGRVTGVIPAALDQREVSHRGIDDLRVVDTMHTRKKIMADESHAFLVLPGGLGTMEELFEVATWRQIGLHSRPIALFNHGGYYDDLLRWLARALSDKLVSPENAAIIEPLVTHAHVEQWLDGLPARSVDPR